jgi:hypothetical protein
MSNFNGCQLPNIPKFAIGSAQPMDRSFGRQMKRRLAVPWNRHVKKWLKQVYYAVLRWQGGSSAQTIAKDFAPAIPLKEGDLVKVRSAQEINSTLDPFKELKGCAFLPDMYQYCDTEQRVLKSMRSFMDERDYKLKKARGVILLENVTCIGTPVFGACDRCCFLFWREEWLEKIGQD